MFQEFKTSYGVVRGVVDGNTVRISRLRYALPPVGARRFAKPAPLEPWVGVVDATGTTAMAPQWPARLAAVMGDYPVEQSEDCLHLDIWVPRENDGKIPVFVFLHGGAFIAGGGGMPCYDGGTLATRGSMIVVNVSYRLGALGLLPIPGTVPANLTLHDQIEALRFIRREIEAFGGDRNRITVAGQSAGALSIAMLLAQPAPQDLFDQAIMLSTPLGPSLETAEEAAETVAKPLLASLGISPGDRQALCAVPVDRLLDAQKHLMLAFADATPPDVLGMPFRPTIDHEIVHVHPAAPEVEFNCPIMMGATRDEFGAFFGFNPSKLESDAEALLLARLEQVFPNDGGRSFRADRPAKSALSMLCELSTDAEFVQPMFDVLNRHAAQGRHGFSYLFDWGPPGSVAGAYHCIELPFLFGNLKTWEQAPMLAGAGLEELSALSHAFQDAIIAFVKSGTPTPEAGPAWPRFINNRSVRHFE